MDLSLPRAGREFITWTVTGVPDGATLEVSVDKGTSWHSLEPHGQDQYRALVAGPDAQDNPDGTVVLASSSTVPVLRLKDATEVVLRKGGAIVLQ